MELLLRFFWGISVHYSFYFLVNQSVSHLLSFATVAGKVMPGHGCSGSTASKCPDERVDLDNDTTSRTFPPALRRVWIQGVRWAVHQFFNGGLAAGYEYDTARM